MGFCVIAADKAPPNEPPGDDLPSQAQRSRSTPIETATADALSIHIGMSDRTGPATSAAGRSPQATVPRATPALHIRANLSGPRTCGQSSELPVQSLAVETMGVVGQDGWIVGQHAFIPAPTGFTAVADGSVGLLSHALAAGHTAGQSGRSQGITRTHDPPCERV
jgi:hypothetical protein